MIIYDLDRAYKNKNKNKNEKRTDCVVQVPVPQIVDDASRPAHDQRAGSKEEDVL